MHAFAIAIVVLGALAASAAPAATGSRVQVQDDATLKISSRTVRLYGIYIPPTNRICDSTFRPIRCGSRAAKALRFRIQKFIYCDHKSRNADGSVNAVCLLSRRGRMFEPKYDLAAYLLERGLAVARPDAPFEYAALERIARAQGRGIWGFLVDGTSR